MTMYVRACDNRNTPGGDGEALDYFTRGAVV